MSCIRQYTYSGNGRQVVQEILTRGDIEACECVVHQMRMEGEDPQTRQILLSQCEERGDFIHTMESAALGMGNDGLDQSTDERNGDINRQGSQIFIRPTTNENDGKQLADKRKTTMRVYSKTHFTYENLILLLVTKRAFNEGCAQRVLSREISGIKFLFSPRATERLKTATTVARILVFQEQTQQRLERAKLYDLSLNPGCNSDDYVDKCISDFETFMNDNAIDIKQFVVDTYKHFNGLYKKKNNFFITGVPSTGKTMIIESLVNCHFNFTRLTGLNSGSTFNFSSLIHTNACFMDECKLTENQFEQWKLLAGGSAMSTDLKYKEKHDVENCVLYTCSNYPIEMYVSAPDAYKAIESRTITYTFTKVITEKFFMNTFIWEKLWETHVDKYL